LLLVVIPVLLLVIMTVQHLIVTIPRWLLRLRMKLSMRRKK